MLDCARQWFVLDKIGAVYEDVGGVSVGEDDAHMLSVKRSLVLRWACQLGHQTCNGDATVLFQLWKQEPYPDKVNPYDFMIF